VLVRSYDFDSAEDPENSNGTHVPFSKKYLTQTVSALREYEKAEFSNDLSRLTMVSLWSSPTFLAMLVNCGSASMNDSASFRLPGAATIGAMMLQLRSERLVLKHSSELFVLLLDVGASQAIVARQKNLTST
jgi:hypothetical protein